jgi:ArsR family transcriptional regulator
MQDKLDSANCSKYLKALAEPERLKLVQCLQGGPKSVGELSREIGSTLAYASLHLKQLRAAGLVRGHKKGRFVFYELAPKILRKSGADAPNTLDFRCCRIELGS